MYGTSIVMLLLFIITVLALDILKLYIIKLYYTYYQKSD